MGEAICHGCGAEKDLALARCAQCGLLPAGAEREEALLCSSAFLSEEQLRAAQGRIRRGERIQPSAELRRQAHARLTQKQTAPAALTPGQIAALVAANLLATPLLGYAVWFRLRRVPGPAARQALLATVPVSALLFVAILAWRFSLGAVVLTIAP